MSEHTIEVTPANFEETISQGKVLVDFWAEWCGPCRQLGPVLDQLAQEHAGKITIGKVNVDQNQDLATKFQVASIPTLILFENGEQKDQMVGLAPKKELEKRLGLA